MIKLSSVAICLNLIASMSNAVQFLSIQEISACVVYLHDEDIQRIQVDGVLKEVWLKGPSDNSPQPNKTTQFGSGFLLADENALFLVTASHVAAFMKSTSLVTLLGPNDTPSQLSLADLEGSANAAWRIHPKADLAILPLRPSSNLISTVLQKRFLPLELLESKELAPERETLLTVIGFPNMLGTQRRFSPLSQQTYAASGLLEMKRFDNSRLATFFILQNPSMGGYSGGPVIDLSVYKLGAVTTTGSGTRCYGIIHGTIGDQTGGKLAAVVPSKFIVELIKGTLSP